ncbi:MAG: L,D-transpeptidase family protein [Solirubrobacteraceae bacterium]|nr:L,D-transpeptidase family protein [Patulibacter sp.]
MRRRIIGYGLVATTAVVLGGMVVGLSAASSGKIDDGVHVGAVDLAGLTPADARARLEREYLAPLQTPIVVQRRGKTFRLSAKEARITADLDATIDEAVRHSAEGNAISDAWKTATGKHEDHDVPVTVTASDDAILRFVDRVRRGVDRKGKSATLTFEDDRPVVSDSQTGMAVDRQELRKLVKAAVTTSDRRPITVPVAAAQPEMSAATLRKQHYTVITVNRNTHVLRLFKGFKLAKRYSVAVGMAGLDTPAGTYTINDKQENPSWHVPMSAWAGSLAGTVVPPGPSNPIKARWMGFFDGAGIHGTSDDGSIGSSASHGCVRMHVADVIDLYPRVPVGTTINVV